MFSQGVRFLDEVFDSVQKTEEMDDGAISSCVCGEPSTKGISEDDTQSLQVNCIK